MITHIGSEWALTVLIVSFWLFHMCLWKSAQNDNTERLNRMVNSAHRTMKHIQCSWIRKTTKYDAITHLSLIVIIAQSPRHNSYVCARIFANWWLISFCRSGLNVSILVLLFFLIISIREANKFDIYGFDILAELNSMKLLICTIRHFCRLLFSSATFDELMILGMSCLSNEIASFPLLN